MLQGIKAYLILSLVAMLALGVGYCNIKKRWAAEFRAQAIEEVQTENKEVLDDAKKRAEKVDQFKPGDYLDYWHSLHGMQPSSPGGGKATPSGKAAPDQP